MDIFDATTNSWTIDYLRDRTSTASVGMSATTIGNKIYFAGGAGDSYGWDYGGDYTSTINIYDVSLGTWSTSYLSQVKGNMAAIAVGNKNIWAGGVNWTYNSNATHPYLDQVEIMDMNSGTSTFNCLFQGNSIFTAVQKITVSFFYCCRRLEFTLFAEQIRHI